MSDSSLLRRQQRNRIRRAAPFILQVRNDDDEELAATTQDSLDDVSLVLLTCDNVRMKTDENGVISGVHEKQLDEKWKPAIIDEVPGNYPQMNYPKLTAVEMMRLRIDADKERDEREASLRREAIRNCSFSNSFRVADSNQSTSTPTLAHHDQSHIESVRKGFSAISIDASDDVVTLEESNPSVFEKPEKLAQFFHGFPTTMPFTSLNKLLFVTGKTEPQAWTTLPKGSMDGRTLKKLGEGSYGEVYSTKWNDVPVAIKVVPFEESEATRKYTGDYNGGAMPTADTILPELLIMKELSALNDLNLTDSAPNFINLLSAEVLKGSYPKGLLKAWNSSNKKKKSQNTNPETFGEDQLYMLLVTEHAGVALEDFKLKDEKEFRSIILQLILSLQAAENALDFEHRDLHLGNVLVERKALDKLVYKHKGIKLEFDPAGIQVRVIDFTLSRIYKGKQVSEVFHFYLFSAGCAVFMDLEEDPDLFKGQGDPQFDVYREMREVCGGDWSQLWKKTNLLWVQYLGYEMIQNKNICPELDEEQHVFCIDAMDGLGLFENCTDCLLGANGFNILAISE